MSKYLEELPLIIRNAIKGLCDEKRQGILIYLKNKGPKSFTDITKEFDLSKANLSHHLRNLMKTGLIYNFYKKNKLNDKYSYYEISKLGKIIIENLISMVSLKKKRKSKEMIHKEKDIIPEVQKPFISEKDVKTFFIDSPGMGIISAKETFKIKEKDSTESKLDFYPMKFL